jgi:hypothetical protein
MIDGTWHSVGQAREFNMSKASIYLPVFAFAAGVASASFAKDVTVQRTTEPGRPVEVWSHSSTRADCATKAPAVTVIQQPANGTVAVSEGPRQLSGNKGDFAKCNGQTGYGAKIVYQPKPGYSGQDGLRYSVRYESGTEMVVIAQVRVGAAAPRSDEGWHSPQASAQAVSVQATAGR